MMMDRKKAAPVAAEGKVKVDVEVETEAE